MAIGTKAGFLINNPFIYTGYTEMLTQFSAAFNEQSGGAITLTSASKRGDTEEKTFFQNISGLVGRRDPTSTADQTDKSLPMSSIKHVKLARKVGPVAQTYDSFRKIGESVGMVGSDHESSGIDTLDMIVGQQTAKAVQVEMVNTAIKALATSLRQVTALKHTDTAATLDSLDLVDGLSKMGDAAAQKIRIWLMHSKQYYNLIKGQISANLDGTTGFVLAEATPVTLNRPVLVIDSPSLVIPDGVSAGVDSYLTLGLGVGAAEVEDTEDMMLASQLITGKENLAVRLQGEYSYNVGVLGFSYDVASGGENPNDAAIGTAANWDKAFADIKDLGGVVVETR